MKKNKVKNVLVCHLTPKLAKSLDKLLTAKQVAIKNANNYPLFQQSYDEFVEAADEVCEVLEKMKVSR